MPTVGELSALYEGFLVGPLHGRDVCEICLTFTDGYERCHACRRCPQWLDAVAPISYSVAHEQLHHALVAYKRLNGEVARRLQLGLAAVLWRFLERHEACVAARARVAGFDLVTAVPSSTPERADTHPLRGIVAELCGPTRERHVGLLARSASQAPLHEFDAEKFTGLARLNGESVLLIDDTWTTGANAQSAAAALKRAGAGAVAVVVIGRHLKRDWSHNDARLRAVARPFDWDTCACCTADGSAVMQPAQRSLR